MLGGNGGVVRAGAKPAHRRIRPSENVRGYLGVQARQPQLQEALVKREYWDHFARGDLKKKEPRGIQSFFDA